VSGDPGIKGKKLSKSSDDTLERRNRSMEKVLDAMIAWARSRTEEDLAAWEKRSLEHERQFGW
jgi:hypothetical protein